MVTHSVKAASHAGRVLFIRDGELFHQLYRGTAPTRSLSENRRYTNACGVLFSKLAELVMVRMLGGQAAFNFTVDFSCIAQTVVLFAAIFLLILLKALRQIHVSNPVELLHSENVGEKPPKANWLVALVGAVLLGTAYVLAVTISDPISALVWFFVAVLMVILATYLLFIAGSVVFCKLLQKQALLL